MKWGLVGEERDGCGDVGGAAVAAHGGFVGEVLVGGVDLALHDHAGSDAVDTDLGRPGFGHGLREHVERGLGGAVVAVGGPGMNAAERADVDDATVGGAQVGQSGLGGEEGRAGVSCEHVVPLEGRDLFERDGFEGAGVVDEDVDAVEVFGHGGNCFGDVFGLGQIAARGEGVDLEAGEVANGLLSFGLRLKKGDRDVRAVLGKREGDGAANAFSAAGDEGSFACKGPFHRLQIWTAGRWRGGVGRRVGCWFGRCRRLFLRVGLYRLLDTGGTAGDLARVVLVRGDLLLRTEEGDGNLMAGLTDEEILRIGREAAGDDLHAKVAAGGNDVDGGLAFGIGFDFHVALVLAVCIDGMEDDGGVDDGLAVGLFDHDDFDMRGFGGSSIFAATTGVGIVLCCERGRQDRQEGTQTESDGEGTRGHGYILPVTEGAGDLRAFHSHFTQARLTEACWVAYG